MKRVFIKLINMYQRTPLLTHASCKLLPTCSEYSKIAIERYGVIKGLYLTIKRLFRCHFTKEVKVDMVPFKEKE